MPKISIIVPVYNVADYLPKCLDSLINQTEKDIEIIVINDCSPDNSEEIILDYASIDSRIKYIKHDTNKRQGGARNTGLSVATGEYIWFVDSDDWIDTNACELLYHKAKAVGADLLHFDGFFVIDGEPRGRLLQYPLDNKVKSGRKFVLKMILTGKKNKIFQVPWCFLFARELIKDERFIENESFEDADFTKSVLYSAKRVLFLDYSGYYYRIDRKDSTTKSISKLETKKYLAKQFERLIIRLFKKGFFIYVIYTCMDYLGISLQILLIKFKIKLGLVKFDRK